MAQSDANCSPSTCQPVDTLAAVDNRRLTRRLGVRKRFFKPRSRRASDRRAISGSGGSIPSGRPGSRRQ